MEVSGRTVSRNVRLDTGKRFLAGLSNQNKNIDDKTEAENFHGWIASVDFRSIQNLLQVSRDRHGFEKEYICTARVSGRVNAERCFCRGTDDAQDLAEYFPNVPCC